jgi:transcriptional regulator with XRE-family HTH domain
VSEVRGGPRSFGDWLDTTMHSRGLSQAQLARTLSVADVQVSRWRRGRVVPSVPMLQRIAETFGVERATLDRLVGLPVAEAKKRRGRTRYSPEFEAELAAHQARLRQVMQRRLPPSLWRAYVEACVALAEALHASVRSDPTVRELLGEPAGTPVYPETPERHFGFRA